MSPSSDRRAAMCMAGFVLGAGVAVASAQSAPPLSALTVPAGSLPDGCQVAPQPPTPTPIVLPDGKLIHRSSHPGKFPTNPWYGKDDTYMVQVQNAIEPAPRVQMPDGPPLERKEISRLVWSLRGHVAEAYHATYQDSFGASIVVQAVRYHDAKWATVNPLQTNRIVRGSTVIRLDSTQPTGCLNAVWTYLQALK